MKPDAHIVRYHGMQRRASDRPAGTEPHRPSASARWLRIAAYGASGLVLALVFASYLNPHLMVDLANRLWACF